MNYSHYLRFIALIKEEFGDFNLYFMRLPSIKDMLSRDIPDDLSSIMVAKISLGNTTIFQMHNHFLVIYHLKGDRITYNHTFYSSKTISKY